MSMVLQKWKNIDILHENEHICVEYLFSGNQDEIAYKIIKMNLIYFDKYMFLSSF